MFVQRLMKKIPYNSTSRKAHYRAYEEPALGYILLALKIIFGLDDISERYIVVVEVTFHGLFPLPFSSPHIGSLKSESDYLVAFPTSCNFCFFWMNLI